MHNEKIQADVLKQLQGVGRKAGLVGIEVIAGVVLADEEWTPQNGLTTATSKLNRNALVEKYKEDIENAYKKAKN